ncbi:MAG: retention module-containing protein [Alistipes senegalensis]|nr:retention module-containing protein [Oxalobacter formigenes]MCM1280679.1 retention module-containing protein [Alistipes senegalensis]
MARAASKAVGEIRSIKGTVKAVDSQGNERVLSAGDKVYADETILPGGEGTALISMPGGGFATVGGNDILVLANLSGVSNGENAMAPDQIQALIAAGADPSDITDATAAGGYEEAGEPGEGQHDFVVVDQLAARGNLTPGFETGTFGDIPPRHWEYDGRYLEVPEDTAEIPRDPGINVPDPKDPEPVDPNNPALPPDVTDGTATVWESQLKGGSANDSAENKAIVKGSFNVAVNGETTILTVGGESIEVDAVGNAILDKAVTVDTGKGILTITGVNGGVVDYTYKLKGAIDADDKTNPGEYTDDISVSVSRPGEVPAATDTLTITIIDDVPAAKADEATLKETADQVAKEVSGNVLGGEGAGAGDVADVRGADGAKVVGVQAGDTGTDQDGGDLTVTGQYGTLTLHADGSYTYTLNADSVTEAMDGKTDVFTYTIKDGDGDLSHTTLTINLENTGPVPTVPVNPDDPTDSHKIVLELKDADTRDGGTSESGEVTADLFDGPQDFDSVKFADDMDLDAIHVEGAAEGESFSWTVNGNTLTGEGTSGSIVTVTLGGIDKDGNVTMSATMENAAHHADGKDDITITGIAVTGTDAGGSSATNSNVTITIVDDAPDISASEGDASTGFGNIVEHNFVVEGGTVSTEAAFKDAGWDSINLDSTDKHVRFGTHNGLLIYGSSVEYTYSEGKVDSVTDTTGKNTGDSSGRYLSLSEDGLSVGGSSSYGGQNDIAAGSESQYAESLILETANRSVSYGIELELGRFDEGDTAVLTFCLTPQNNDDNFPVLTKVITWDTPGITIENGIAKITIEVPDGFNKLFLSAGESTATGDEAGFTLRGINYSHPYSQHEGTVDVKPGADGMAEGSLTWDWSGVKALLNDGIKVTGSPGAGDYTVAWKVPGENGTYIDVSSLDGLAAGTTLIAVLQGNNTNGAVSLDGNPLLEATLGADGKWNIKQVYNFTLPDGSDPQLNFTFSVTDKDGDTAETDNVNVTLNSPAVDERFDNVDVGKWPGGSNDANNHVGDFLQGGQSGQTGNEFNDLLFGRGGNDLLFGDNFQDKDGNALTAAEALKEAFGEGIFEKIEGGYEGFLQHVANADPDTNKSNILHKDISAISDALKGMLKDGTLDDALAKLEGLQAPKGGDDALFGGLETDILFGGGGNDYLIGNGQYSTDVKDKQPDTDILIGGSGSDIIVYDAADAIIRGGSGIDVLLVGKDDQIDLTQQGITSRVNGMEVLIRANHTSQVTQLGITSLEALKNYGVTIDSDTHTMSLDMSKWTDKGDGKYEYKDGSITLETTLSTPATLDKGSTLVFTEAGYHLTPGNAEEMANGGNVIGRESDTDPNYVAGTAGNDTFTGGSADDVIYGDASGTPTYSTTEGVAGDLADSIGKISASTPSRIITQLIEGKGRWVSSTDNLRINDSNQNIIDRLEAFDDAVDGKDIYGKGNDNLTGGAGQDVIFGMGGNDYLDGGAGRDVLSGGSGNDILVYDQNDYVVYGGKGIDVLLAGKDDKPLADLLKQDGKTINQVVGGVEVLLRTTKDADPRKMGITSLNDLALIGVVISGDLLALDKTWTLGEDGKYTNNDGLVLEVAGLDKQVLPDGVEGTVFASGDYHGNPAADIADLLGTITGTHDNDILFGANDQQALADTLAGLKDVNVAINDANSIRNNPDAVAEALEQEGVSSGEGDTLIGNGGDDVLFGGQGNDVLLGGDGNDMLFGGSGDDVLIGGKGSDTMTGGAGSDTFKWQEGDLDNGSVDKILDFTLGDTKDGGDVLDISDLLSGRPEGLEGKDLIDGGYLNFTDIKQNDDGTTTLTITVDTDGKGEAAGSVELAQVTVSGLGDLSGAADPAQEILNQLVNNDQITF